MSNLNVLMNGPGAAISLFLDIIRLNGLKLFQNENECRKDLMNTQTAMVKSEAAQVIDSYENQSRQTMMEAAMGFLSAFLSVAATAGITAKAGLQLRKTKQYTDTQQRFKEYREATPAAGKQRLEVVESGENTPEPKTPQEKLNELLSNPDHPAYKKPYKEFINDIDTELHERQALLMQNPAEKAALESKENDFIASLTAKLEELKQSAQTYVTMAQTCASSASGMAKATGDATNAELKKELGDIEAARKMFEFAVELSKQAREIFNNNCQAVVQNIKAAADALEAAVYANGGYRG